MELKDTQAFVDGCFRDEPASCACACPFHLDIIAFLKKLERGRFPAAYRDLSTAILFPSVAAELCPRPCRDSCQRTACGDAPLDMGALERACVRFAANERPLSFPLPPKDKSVAVIGGGAAGLACAISLARKKYSVSVFEKEPEWGGALRSHPGFALFDADFSKQFSTENVDFRFNTEITSLDDISGFDAYYIATGEGGNDFGLREGWSPSVLTTERPGCFAGGALCGMSLMDSIAVGGRLSQLFEAYLQTGKAALIVNRALSSCSGHMLAHTGEASKPIVVPADREAGYTKDEAKAEASRCMQCICTGCMDSCELLGKYKKPPTKLAVDICGDSHTSPPFSNCEATRETYSCNMCSSCAEACPTGVDMKKLFRYSREDRWKQGKWVPALHDFWLKEMDFSRGEGFFASAGKGKSTCNYLFFPGCQLTAVRPKHVLSAYALLREKFNAGIMLGCCGAPAIWAGDVSRREENTALLYGKWSAMGRPVIVTACATCVDMLSELLPEAETRSLYELLVEADAPCAGLSLDSAEIFDPCSAKKNDAMRAAVRALAKKSGMQAHELPISGKCCGYGGHMRLADPALYKEIAANRAAAGEEPYIVYCANCLEVFTVQGKPCAHILDAVFGDDGAGIPALDEKRRNALSVKGELVQMLNDEKFCPPASAWDSVKLVIDGDVLADMEDKLISSDELRKAVFLAESDKDYFEDETGLRTACLVDDVITYWVDYRENEPGSYAVVSAYCHRMRFGEEGEK